MRRVTSNSIADISSLIFCFNSVKALGLLTYTLSLRDLQRQHSQANKSGDLAGKGKGKVHPCTGTEDLYRAYSQ